MRELLRPLNSFKRLANCPAADLKPIILNDCGLFFLEAVMDISFLSDIEAVMNSVAEHQKKRVAYAAKFALDKTARQAKYDLIAGLDEQIDRPTPFTKFGIGTSNAHTNNLQYSVFIKDLQTKYMQYQVLGGRRDQKPYEKKLAAYVGDRVTVISKYAKQNKHGNLSRNTINKIVERVITNAFGVTAGGKHYFIGRPAGGRLPDGVWEKSKNRLKPILLFVTRADYTKRFKFNDIAEQSVRENFNRLFDDELSRRL
jgi:hypothetical protein